MPSNPPLAPDTEKKLAEYIAQFRYDFLGLVMALFPWGQKGTPLANRNGPYKWQRELLVELGRFMRENAFRKQLDLDYLVWRSAVASGHGVGKSAFVAWLIYCIMSTRPNARGVVTANTGTQLETKTWPELAKWHAMALNKHWFTWTSTSFFFAQYPPDRQKNYMTSALTVSEENTEAFAGMHNDESAVFAIFDEASGIISNVWEVVEGALTDGEPFFFVFGNPTRPEGEFYNCFDKYKQMYWRKHVDSREVPGTNKSQLNNIIDKYGADSDEAKIRVYGQFPTKSYDGFINAQLVHDAMTRQSFTDHGEALIMGVDVASSGADTTVICFRQGKDARSIPWTVLYGATDLIVANRVAELANKYRPDAIVIESIGPGAGVISALKIWNYRVVEFHPGIRQHKESLFYNNRAEVWHKGREWLQDGGCLPDNPELFKQLTQMIYTLDLQEQKIVMESKRDMRARGLPSPDDADSLMLTFAVKVARRDMMASRSGLKRSDQTSITDYDVLAY